MNEAPSAAIVAHPERLDGLIAACKALAPVPTGVVYPLSGDALLGAAEAARDGLISPVLIARKKKSATWPPRKTSTWAPGKSSTCPTPRTPPPGPARWRAAAKSRP